MSDESVTTKLSVNVNKIALLRNARDGGVPSVVELSRLALDAGAHGITVHPRPDQRHIRVTDVDALAELLASPEYADREFNIEGNPLDSGGNPGSAHLMPILERVKPTQATFVPDNPNQNTSDHGFALTQPAVVDQLRPVVAQLKDWGCRVSLFVDPEPDDAAAAAQTGTDRIELYTESYAKAFGTPSRDVTLARFVATAERARTAGLGVNAGHDLDLHNLPTFATGVSGLEEVSIGHALVADALTYGMRQVVNFYMSVLNND
ncbi:MAG: pyridoxine 5'-phosphate synthase [Planctomycetota bacterium]